MKILWHMFDGFDNSADRFLKRAVFLACNILFFGLAGAVTGMALRLITDGAVAGSAVALICFAAYPAAFFGFFGGIICIYRECSSDEKCTEPKISGDDMGGRGIEEMLEARREKRFGIRNEMRSGEKKLERSVIAAKTAEKN